MVSQLVSWLDSEVAPQAPVLEHLVTASGTAWEDCGNFGS